MLFRSKTKEESSNRIQLKNTKYIKRKMTTNALMTINNIEEEKLEVIHNVEDKKKIPEKIENMVNYHIVIIDIKRNRKYKS